MSLDAYDDTVRHEVAHARWVPVILSQGLICASSQDPRKIKFWIRLREGQVIRHLQYSCHYYSPTSVTC